MAPYGVGDLGQPFSSNTQEIEPQVIFEIYTFEITAMSVGDKEMIYTLIITSIKLIALGMDLYSWLCIITLQCDILALVLLFGPANEN